MKNTIKRIAALAVCMIVALSFVSCDDYLDNAPEDPNTVDKIFENRTSVQRWLAFVYDGIPKCFTYDGPDAVADDMQVSLGWESQGFSAISYQNGNWTPARSGVISYWPSTTNSNDGNSFFKRIRQAYIFIEKAHPIDEVLNATEINRMKAECRFLIAYYHSIMLMTYGAIPIIDKAVASLDDVGNAMPVQAPFHDAVKWCSDEMLAASELLPEKYYTIDDSKYGRITSVMCLAMRARLLLFAASDLVNGTDNPGMVAMVNGNGNPVFDPEYDPERWKAAAEAAKLLIDAAEAAGHQLHIEYLPGTNDIDPFMSCLNSIMLRCDQGNLENLFPRVHDDGGWLDNQSNPRGAGGSGAGALGLTQSLVDAFFMRNGLVPITGYAADGFTPIINPDSGYSETGYTTANEFYPTAYQWASSTGSKEAVSNMIVPANTYKMYSNREPRFYVSVLRNEQWHWGTNRNTDFFFGGRDGQPSHDSPSAGYLARKRIDPTWRTTGGTYGSRHGVLYRLAEAYLSYAEALTEYSIDKGSYAANQTEILKYLNMIRKRAGIPMYGPDAGMIPVPATGEAMLDLIRRERRVELCCENGLRFNDLRRWEQAEKVLGSTFFGMNMSATASNRDAFYTRVPYQQRVFRSYWWPVPQTDIDVNTNLRQLPGWN